MLPISIGLSLQLITLVLHFELQCLEEASNASRAFQWADKCMHQMEFTEHTLVVTIRRGNALSEAKQKHSCQNG